MSHIAAILVPFVALIAAGAMVVRLGVLSGEAMRGLANLVLVVEIPVLLFRSLASQDLRHGFDLRINLAYFGGCLLVLLVSLLIGRLVLRLDQSQCGIFGLSAIYSNSSLLGVPIIQAAFGAPGLLLLGKIIAFHSLLLLPLGTVLVVFGRADQAGLAARLGEILRATVANPIIIGLVAGAAWSLTGRGLAEPVDRVSAMLADAATPTALLALGGMQGRIGWHQAKQAAASVTLKLAVHPLIVCLLAMSLGGLPPASIAVATITASLPAGMNVYLMARQYDCYVDEATATTTLGTLLSVLSIALALQFSLGFH